MGLFGGDTIIETPTLNEWDIYGIQNYVKDLTAASPREQEFVNWLSQMVRGVDQNVVDEMGRLRERGDDLANLDQAYFDRAFTPAYQRLMEGHADLDRGILEDMNRRGIVSVGSSADNLTGVAGSEPEAYARMLLARDTKNQAGRTMLEAQNQAVQQKLAQYNARLAEVDQANVRRGQIVDPYQEAVVMPEGERQALKGNMAANMYNARLGHESKMHEINTNRKLAGQQQLMGAIGGGMGMLGTLGAGLAMSDPDLKKDRRPESPEQSLDELRDVPVDRWSYAWEDEERVGPMSTDMPPDTQALDGSAIDTVSYMGKMHNSIKALDKRLSAFERLLQGGMA